MKKREEISRKNEAGFTLLELIAALGLFALLMVPITSLLVSSSKTQRYALASQRIASQASYAMEYMSRAIRMARKDSAGTCILQGKNYAITASGGLRFMNYKGVCQEFSIEGSGAGARIKESAAGGAGSYLFSPDITNGPLNFIILGESPGQQPKVSFSLTAKTAGQGNQPEIKLQTTVSQRNLNIAP